MSDWLEDYINNPVNHITFNTVPYNPNNSFPWVRKSNLPKYPLSWELEIKKVIFNGPATVVLWSDGTKTVVKCSENEEFDPEKGVAMAVWKKFLPSQYGRKAKRMINNARNVGKTDKPEKSCINCKYFSTFRPFTNIPFTSSPCFSCTSMNHYEEKK